ncbi:Pao retrotransposon peptidase [Trichostrongylus colubriformis]|uniref:Pao retrotransposon peptidase n=1 Tax=Trichostrongylus colubriformis TaxID=6319 RepID=A0AAN8G7U6_TRICO
MNLREFCSNEERLSEKIAAKDLSLNVDQKVLGMPWHSREDQIVLRCRYRAKMKMTKRSISEQIASIYDPLGLLTPITLKGKQFLQELWKYEYDWDTPLYTEHQQKWENIVNDVDGFQMMLPRQVAGAHSACNLVLFADASCAGMATCAYLVSEHGSHLVTGKSKLPSLKDSPTVQKLELNALTMATRLSYSIHVALRHKVDIKNVLIMSDTEISLSWIKATKVEKLHGVLIKNRVAEIRRIVAEISTTVRFGYVKTSDNPADCGTRGVMKSELNGHMWWHGPSFISNDPETWHEESRLFTLPTEDCGEQVCLVAKTAEEPSVLLDWSRYNRLVSATRTMAYVLRFLHNISMRVREKLKERLQNTIPELCYMTSEPFITAVENRVALQVMVRHHQKTQYTSEQLKLLKQLNVREDENGF